MGSPEQTPSPGEHLLRFCGDTVTFKLILRRQRDGSGWLRTNVGNARLHRQEIIAQVERETPPRAADWQDVPMRQTGATTFVVTMPVAEVGCFEAKTFFLPDSDPDPVWPEGGNVMIKVEPADRCCANTIYTAFVRQFGPNARAPQESDQTQAAESLLEEHGYTVIPRSGTFRELVRQLDVIIGTLRFRIIQLLPIHPTPTTYARMGRFGSPYAVLDFLDVDPALAEFDRQTTPLDQFRELVEAVHHRHASIFIDIPINHTGWASALQVQRPEWFVRNPDRTFQSPGAWGVTWEDLSELDYTHRDLWTYMADVFLYWCRQGVDGFRCDAGYMVPVPVWKYIVAKVRTEYPDTVFLLEGLGGKVEVMEQLLTDANLNWAYSELFQNYDRHQVGSYLPGCIRLSVTEGALVHFAETHDNERLAARSHTYARLRTALTAMCSHTGAFGITNGVEWLADQKLDVHAATSLNWASEPNLVEHIARLNAILDTHPSFGARAQLKMIECSAASSMALHRATQDSTPDVLILANLNDREPDTASWSEADCQIDPALVFDLISGDAVTIASQHGRSTCELAPGSVVCLAAGNEHLSILTDALQADIDEPKAVTRQRQRAKAAQVHSFFRGIQGLAEADPQALASRLTENPRLFCADLAERTLPPVSTWRWPTDARRQVMVPSGWVLHVQCPCRFVAELCRGDNVVCRERSLCADDGAHFALLLPPHQRAPARHEQCRLRLTTYGAEGCGRLESTVLLLAHGSEARVQLSVEREQAQALSSYALCTNGRGAMSQVRSSWGEVCSQYDAILAANLDPEVPVDRRNLLTRYRAWLVYRGYSQAVDHTCLQRFSVDAEGRVCWRFALSAGLGKLVQLKAELVLHSGGNSATVRFTREHPRDAASALDDDRPVQLIVRPDIEDRCSHEKTKAYTGAETAWTRAVEPGATGFSFAPGASHRLRVAARTGTFTLEPEWTYMVAHPVETQRGLDGSSDLFSPGYFVLTLAGGQHADLVADVLGPAPSAMPAAPPFAGNDDKAQGPAELLSHLKSAMRHFLVKRDNSLTVIAGYPWFLDWGRDTLICLRGYIAAGFTAEALDVLTQFARFERQGTLPNMIRGNDDSDRDTSDAPLWFLVACAELLDASRPAQRPAILATQCGKRTLRSVVLSIAEAYMQGTPNGIRMDPETNLIFSPAHFTWMDTNHPTGTPREGYPIEIQALWHAGLLFLSKQDAAGPWSEMARNVRRALRSLYTQNAPGYLSDCLHAKPGTGARQASADDHLRPNQLLAVCLGAVTAPALCRRVLAACEELLVPGAIRSLADRPVRHPLPVRHRGQVLNDPQRPYWGRYGGDEDTRRKPAYHNGTAWTWPFPSYAEALLLTYGKEARDTAISLLGSSVELLNRGCIGHVPEIVDGDAPHDLRGCGAQAWGETELYRVLAILTQR